MNFINKKNELYAFITYIKSLKFMQYVWLVFYKFGLNIVTWEISLMEGVENTLEILEEVFKGHVPYQGGGVEPPPTKKICFFRQNVKNSLHALKNLFHSNPFSVLSPLSEYRF